MRLVAGDIVAVRDIDGFHLVCNTGNPTVVAALRVRKHRPAKPLVVTLLSAAGLPTNAAASMGSPVVPIVLIVKAQISNLCDRAASGLVKVGAMLPSNPLRHLFPQALVRPTVMTSGNLSGRPPALSNAQAPNNLADTADDFLLHDRDILQRIDDSLVWPSGEMLRYVRDYVPDAPPLPPGLRDIPPLLALGADMKSTFCLMRGSEAVLSQCFGDFGKEDIKQQRRSAL